MKDEKDEEKKTDVWTELPKADTKAEVLPRNEVPTRECGSSLLNWGLEANKRPATQKVRAKRAPK